MSAGASAPAGPPAAPLACTLEGPARLRAGEPARFTLKLQNRGARAVHLLSWATPFEPAWFAPWLVVQRNGKALPYGGAKMKRGDPQAADYVAIAPGASASAAFELAPAFDLATPGRYTLRPRIVLHDLLLGDGSALPRPLAQHQPHRLRCNDLAFELTSP